MRRATVALAALLSCRPGDREAPTASRGSDLVGPEIDGIAGPPLVVAAAHASVSYDGTDFLVVWNDLRSQATWDLFATVARSAGGVSKSGGGLVHKGAGTNARPRAAWNGTHHLVVWDDGAGNVLARRLDASAASVDTSALVLSTTGRWPAVVSDGTQWMVAWNDDRSGTNQTYAARVSSARVTLDVGGISAAPTVPSDGTFVGVGYSAGKLLVAFTRSTSVHAVRFASAGTVLDATPLTVANGTGRRLGPSVVGDGTQFLVGWDLFDAQDVEAARVSAAGVLLDTTPLAVAKASSRQWLSTFAFDGTNFIGAWSDGRSGTGEEPYATRISTGGAVLDPAGVRIFSPGNSSTPALGAGGGKGYLAIEAAGLQGTRVSTSTLAGTDVPPVTLALASGAQFDPSVAKCATYTMLVWREITATGHALRAQRYDATLAPVGSVLTLGSALGISGRVAPLGAGVVAVWPESGTVYAQRFGADGLAIDATPLTVAAGAGYQVAVASVGAQALVTWVSSGDVVGRRLPATGGFADPTPVTLGTGGEHAVGSDGSGYLVAWSTGKILARRIDTTGAPLGSGAITVSGTGTSRTPAVAGRSGGFLVAFADQRSGTGLDIYGARVDPSGSVLDSAGIPISTGTFDQTNPTVTADGGAFFVAWADKKGGAFDIFGAPVLASGVVGAPAPLQLSALADDEASPALATDGAGSRVLAYVRPTDAERLYRVHLRAIVGHEDSHACAKDGDCLSEHCVDGVCCATTCAALCAACDVTGKVGVCSAVTGAPHGSRGPCSGIAGGVCGARCDGTSMSACSYPDTSAPCGVDGCTGGTETHTSTCDGAGKCSDLPKSCGTFACDATKCKVTCTSKADCAPGNYCKAGACAPIEELGTKCTDTSTCKSGSCVDGVCCEAASCPTGSSCAPSGLCKKLEATKCGAGPDCASGFCVDGVCCDRACDSQCEACDVVAGKCQPVTGAPHGGRKACDDGKGVACAARKCDGVAAACTGYTQSTETLCGTATCVDETTESPAPACDGTGVCKPAADRKCGAYRCRGGCLAACTTALDCAPKFTCIAGKCAPSVATCVDEVTSQGTDGAKVACAPYRCGPAGTCLTGCTSGADCAPGNECSSGFVCQPIGGGAASDGGCSMTPPKSQHTACAVFMLLLSCRRRRR